MRQRSALPRGEICCSSSSQEFARKPVSEFLTLSIPSRSRVPTTFRYDPYSTLLIALSCLPPKSTEVIFDSTTHKLSLHLDLGDEYWILGLLAIFSTLIPGDENLDVGPYAISGNSLLLAPSADEARKELQQAGLTPPSTDEPSDFEFEETDLVDISTGGAPPETESEDEPAAEEEAGGDQGETSPYPRNVDGEGSKTRKTEAKPLSGDEKTGETKYRSPQGAGSDSEERRSQDVPNGCGLMSFHSPR